ncbi:MAG: nicotinamide-nucleotide amidohydrolase family protein, partial [Pseudoflavonifractor sp.]
PGPPNECQPMFEFRAKPYLQALSQGVIASRTLRIFGMGESSVESRLREKMNAMQNPTLAPYAKTGEVELRITAKADTDAAAAALIAPVEAELRAMFGPLVYGADIANLEETVLTLLQERHLTLSAAESCTGGLIAKRVTDIPGASAVFKGGVVCYCNEIKQSLLGVPAALLEQYGAVSEPVAIAMAEGARRVLGSDLALSATGVAGPDRDQRDNPVGLVYIALATPDGTRVRALHQGTGRERIRITAASHGFDMARRYLTGLPDREG